MEEQVKFQTFNYFVENVIEVNQIVAIVKCIIEKLELIVVREKQSILNLNPRLINIQLKLGNVLELPKKGKDVRIRRKIQMDVAITINKF